MNKYNVNFIRLQQSNQKLLNKGTVGAKAERLTAAPRVLSLIPTQ